MALCTAPRLQCRGQRTRDPRLVLTDWERPLEEETLS